VGLYLHTPIRLQGVLLNVLGAGTTLPFHLFIMSQASSVGTATGYVLDGRGLVIGRERRLFFHPQSPDRL
jgi:hypothetical protein